MDEVMEAPPRRRRWGEHVRARLRVFNDDLMVAAVILLALLLFLIPSIVVTIPAGHVGVKWKRFAGGTVPDVVLPEGTALILPWDSVIIYDARLQKVERDIEVLSSDGLKITLNLVWHFRILPQMAPRLHQYVGPDYADSMLAPTVGARTRDIIAVYQPDEVYTERRMRIQNQILESVRYDLQENFNSPLRGTREQWLHFEDILIRGMTLPPGVQEAIVRKNAMFHEMEEYTFRVQREQKEAERKRIEAVGIRNFQEIVSNGMSDSYLRWRGIEATLELARSPNAKVVVVGSGKNGLPLILNADGESRLPAAGTQPAPQSERAGR
jgi:regulator of protease activity HflC (stomatin/prohibitin superfamily)